MISRVTMRIYAPSEIHIVRGYKIFGETSHQNCHSVVHVIFH